MNEEIRSLIDSIRRGQYEDPAGKIELLAAALQEHGAGQELLDSLFAAPQVPLRLAVLEFCRHRRDAGQGAWYLKLARDADTRVRAKLCEVVALLPDEVATEPLKVLTGDADSDIREQALKATNGKPPFLEIQRERLRTDTDWSVRHAAAAALAEQNDGLGLGDLLTALANDDDADVRQRCAEQLEKHLVQDSEAAVARLPTDPPLLAKAEKQAGTVGAHVPQLQAWLRGQTQLVVNPQELARFGTDLTAQALNGTLPRAFRLEAQVGALLERLKRERPRSIALLGKSGAGKSSLVNELVYALAKPEHGSWRVIRMSPTDFMAGTKYVGDWETKVGELIEAFRRPRRAVLYIPNLADLTAMGRWSKSDANVATALAPYLEDGSVLVIGESSPDEFERGFGADLALQRVFDRVLVEEFSREDTRAVLGEIREQAKANLDDAVLGELQEASEFFLGHLTRPGNAAMLLRAVISAVKDAGRPAARRDVLDVLSESTGVPADLLDDNKPLDLGTLGGFFEQRIIGQPEAVAAMVDVVTLIKSGLTDPGKPFNVMLFVGPTGVGKTELARALAEYIFGDAARLLRFDMSEFAGPDGFTRLIGGRGENGLLTDAVLQRPFSVVLLDEIEKSHVNVFDLCLQIFDAGRLTDGRGRLVDFRRSIVILTSNVGAEGPGTTLGFGQATGPATVDADRTFRELSRCFRPEFLNRLDRIVNFRPLSLETAERIARRELDLVLRRSGVARRGLTVNVDPNVLPLLVKQGYSPHFGARPLKRTVEKLVLLPLARAIAAGRAEARSVVTLNADGEGIAVKLVQPARPKAVREHAAKPEPWRRQVAELQERFRALDAELWPLPARKSQLVAATQAAGFYQDTARRDATFDELNRIEHFLTRHTRLNEALERLAQQTVSEAARVDVPAVEERLAELGSELEQLQFVSRNRDAAELSDAWVLISRVSAQGMPINAMELLAQTYLGLAQRRQFQAVITAERRDDRSEVLLLQLLGLGATALISGESGLHEFNRRRREKNPRSGREETHQDTTVARVEVFPLPAGPPKKFAAETNLKATALKSADAWLLERVSWQVTAFHEASIRSLDLRFPGEKNEALANAARFFHAQVSRPAATPNADTLIRRYDIGIGSRIKDLRTGRTTTRLAQFFRGQVEMTAPE